MTDRFVALRLALAVVVAMLVACAPEDAAEESPAEPPETPDEPADPPDDAEADMELTGTFGGDPDLEGGCAWVEAEDTRYEVLWPEGYEVGWEPLELHGPDGDVVAGAGDDVRVTGRLAEDMVSICMVGPIVEAESVEAP